MKYRTVMMYMQIGCFVSCLCGWILVCSTLPTEYWTFSEVGSIVLTTSNYYSNLWRDCISDTTGVSDCKDYPSMLALPGRTRPSSMYRILTVALEDLICVFPLRVPARLQSSGRVLRHHRILRRCPRSRRDEMH